jgi:hypothetical protein
VGAFCASRHDLISTIRGFHSVVPLGGLRNLPGELGDVRALMGTDDGETTAVLLEPGVPTELDRRLVIVQLYHALVSSV